MNRTAVRLLVVALLVVGLVAPVAANAAGPRVTDGFFWGDCANFLGNDTTGAGWTPALDDLLPYDGDGVDAAGRTTYTGTSGNDIVYVDHDNDVPTYVMMGDGNDYYCGGDLKDIVWMGPGDDEAYGADDNDKIFGGPGFDWIFGGRGDDKLRGNADNDTIHGGPGNDLIWGKSDQDALAGNAGNDVIRGGDGDDGISGGVGYGLAGGEGAFGDGIETLLAVDVDHFDDGADKVIGGAGDDVVSGGLNADQVFGGNGFDCLYGGLVNDDVAEGLAPDNPLMACSVNFWATGQTGNQEAVDANGDGIADLADLGDKIRGGGLDDEIYGGTGDDDIGGGPALFGDWMVGGPGDDVLACGSAPGLELDSADTNWGAALGDPLQDDGFDTSTDDCEFFGTEINL